MSLLNSFPGGNGGSQITVDSALSTTSENPVQNKVITTEINKKANATALDSKADLVDGKIPASQLPSYVDDVIEGYAKDLGIKYSDIIAKFNEISGATVNYTGSNTALIHCFVANKNGSTLKFFSVRKGPETNTYGTFILGGDNTTPTYNTDAAYNVLYRYSSDGGISDIPINFTNGTFPGFNDSYDAAKPFAIATAPDGIYYTGKVNVENFTGNNITHLNVAHQYGFYTDDAYTTQITPETGKIYIDIPTGRSFRWTGTEFVEISSGGVVLGETADTAYRGDRGKVAYEISQANATAIGDLSTLTTTDKTDVVSAVNELESEKLTGDVLTAQDIEDIKAAFQANVSQQWIMTQHFNRDNIYSTDEKLVGCWIDGRPLYQKVINCEGIPNTNIKTVSTGLANANIKKLFGYAERTSDGTVLPLNYMNTDSANKGIQIQTISNGGNITIRTGADLSAFTNAYIVIQYTKTTDAANSFKLADENDYSTTEHVVGTWIDGKPVYQKTIDCGALPNASTKNVNSGISNLDKIIKLSGSYNSSSFGGAIPNPVERAEPSDYSVRPYYNKSDNKIYIATGTDLTSYNVYITIQYTKTTD